MDAAANVEIYIGKFKDDFTGIERWIQVTTNKLGRLLARMCGSSRRKAEPCRGWASAPEVPEEKSARGPLDTKGEVVCVANRSGRGTRSSMRRLAAIPSVFGAISGTKGPTCPFFT